MFGSLTALICGGPGISYSSWVAFGFRTISLHGIHGRLLRSQWFVIQTLDLLPCHELSERRVLTDRKCTRLTFLAFKRNSCYFRSCSFAFGTNVKSICECECDNFGMKCWIIHSWYGIRARILLIHGLCCCSWLCSFLYWTFFSRVVKSWNKIFKIVPHPLAPGWMWPIHFDDEWHFV